MAESPTPETGTPESQSPARTPPALITTEELLQSISAKSPEAPTSPFEPSPSGSVSRARTAPAPRYEHLRAADAAHRLRGLILPPEEELRAAALGGRPAVGPPPTLPHQLSPALQSVLHGWRSVYESCSPGPVLQALVGACYAHDAVFEDALVSARGQEAVYRQFAMLGAAVRAVQIAAYSLSVAPLGRPVVLLEQPAASPDGGSGGGSAISTVTPPRAATAPPSGPQAGRLAHPAPPRPPPHAAAAGMGVATGAAGPVQQQQQQQQQPLHLTRVTVENVQCFQLGVPPWLTWLVGSKSSSGLQVHLYVTSILLVASDAPLAMGLDGAGGTGGAAGSGEWPVDVTARRLAGVAAALGRDGIDPFAGGTGGSAAAAATGDSGCPNWRIVHQVDVWHNVPLLWWRLRRSLCVALDTLLAPLLRL